MRQENWLIGYGMAGVVFVFYRRPCRVDITVRSDGTAVLRSAATDIGTGTYTILTQLGAELLGVDPARVKVEIGDSDLPPAPQSGGSGLAGSLADATHDGASKLLRALLSLLTADERSPLRGARPEDVGLGDGGIRRLDDSSVGESYATILSRHRLTELTARGELEAQPTAGATVPAGAFAAHFVEVRVDEDLGTPHVTRLVTAVDAGRVLNTKTARSQIMGAAVMGIGMALLEETVFERNTGRIANATFGDYLIPVNADVPDLDITFVGKPDRTGPVGTKGIGEVGVIGVGAAIANAVFHATGRRIRSLPITIEKVLGISGAE